MRPLCREVNRVKGKKLAWAVFLVYCAAMLWLLFGRDGYFADVPYWDQVHRNLNLQPFKTIDMYLLYLDRPDSYMQPYSVVNLYGNVLLFIPLGLYLPRLVMKKPRFWKTILWTAVIITTVELIQLFTLVGSCDVDDLILNVLGAAIGHGLYRFTVKKLP